MTMVFLNGRKSPFGFRNRKEVKEPEVEEEKNRNEIIREQKAAGVSAKALAEQYGVSIPRIYQICQKK